MEAAKAKGAELRIGTVEGVSSAPVESSEEGKDKGAGSRGGRGGGEKGVSDERQITGVLLDSGEQIPCDKVI